MTLFSIVNKRVHGFHTIPNLGGIIEPSGDPLLEILGGGDEPLFLDTFASGSKSPSQNGYGWGAVNGNTNEIIVVDDPLSASGKALRFRFGNLSGGGGWSEQRYFLGQDKTELYFSFDIREPSNYFHRDGPSSDNNKFYRLWGGDYSSSAIPPVTVGVKFGCSTYRTTSGGSNLHFTNETIGRTASDGSLYVDFNPNEVSFINLATDLNFYRRMIFHIKVASGPNMLDGIHQFWMRSPITAAPVLKVDKQDCDVWDYSPTKYNFVRNGYLLGAPNSGYDELTYRYISRFAIGDSFASVA